MQPMRPRPPGDDAPGEVAEAGVSAEGTGGPVPVDPCWGSALCARSPSSLKHRPTPPSALSVVFPRWLQRRRADIAPGCKAVSRHCPGSVQCASASHGGEHVGRHGAYRAAGAMQGGRGRQGACGQQAAHLGREQMLPHRRSHHRIQSRPHACSMRPRPRMNGHRPQLRGGAAEVWLCCCSSCRGRQLPAAARHSRRREQIFAAAKLTWHECKSCAAQRRPSTSRQAQALPSDCVILKQIIEGSRTQLARVAPSSASGLLCCAGSDCSGRSSGGAAAAVGAGEGGL